jgi:hypothetical protein
MSDVPNYKTYILYMNCSIPVQFSIRTLAHCQCFANAAAGSSAVIASCSGKSKGMVSYLHQHHRASICLPCSQLSSGVQSRVGHVWTFTMLYVI